MNTRRLTWMLGALILLVVGFGLGRLGGERDDGSAGERAPAAADAITWTCSMHPQIRLPEPGKCPICFMDLIPVTGGDAGDDGAAPTLTMTTAAAQLAEIQTTPVVSRHPVRPVDLVGKIEYDETRRRQITAWTGGRLDRLYVDFTGIEIRKGDHLAQIYSPELISAQEELLQALHAAEDLSGSSVTLLRESTQETIEAAREKLRLLGLSPAQVQAVEARGEVEDHVTIMAPMNGVVIAKRALEGSYVNTGAVIYEVADLSRVWLMLDAYESDLPWLRYGQETTFTVEALPGHSFEGRVVFIDPVLDPRTRTARVRVNVDNTDLALKPGMFAHASVQARLAGGGKVMAPDLAGKWISPMHPEIIKDRPGTCDVCGMKLVRAEDLGYEVPSAASAPLIIPASAPLITGKRAVVYVRVPERERATFEGREIVLGPRAGDEYVVLEGLIEGEEVVKHGAFKIDSAMQIQAKPSMMLPEGGATPSPHDHGARETSPPPSTLPVRHEAPAAFQGQLDGVITSYLELTRSLAGDRETAARQAADALEEALGNVDMALLDEDAHRAWMSILEDLRPAAERASTAGTVNGLRAALPDLTAALARAVRTFGVGDERELYRFHCPMAFENKGADWLYDGRDVLNPYYGAAMLRCGSQVEVLARTPEDGS